MKRRFALLALTVYVVCLAGLALAQVPEGVARIHYQRPDGLYQGWELHVWEDTTDAVTWQSGLRPAGETDYGVYWDVNLAENARRVGFIVHRGDEKDPGPDMFLLLDVHGNEIWLVSGSEQIYTSRPLPPPAPGTARIHYFRPDGAYEGFELHVWEDTTDVVTWQDGLDIAGRTDYGVYWVVNLKEGAARVGFIVHRGDEKDPGPDMFLVLAEHGNEIWLISGSDTIYTARPDIRTLPSGDLGKAQAHWVSRDTIAWNVGTVLPSYTFTLHYHPDGALTLTQEGVIGGETLSLSYDPGGLDAEITGRFPHLAEYAALTLSTGDLTLVPELLKGQVAVSLHSDGKLLDATGLQIPGVLDDLYATDAPLGVHWAGATPSISVWAPTARSVALHLFPDSRSPAEAVLAMQRDDATGVWTITGDPAWRGKYYLFEVEVYVPSTRRVERNLVTDPYALSLAMNSTRSQIIDLNDPALKPEGWDTLVKPALTAFTDITIYELHVRDFSAYDPLVPEALKGTYLAFTLPDSYGLRHLRALAEAGLTHLHLLPTFDIATIDEDKSRWRSVDEALLRSYPPNSHRQQEEIGQIRDYDAFNWGYDPYHFTVPEGSYSTDPDGPTRILEYRQMVMALNAMGLRVAKDVVYNHTNASGQADKSVLDRIVPGYYHRLNRDGFVETSTCCPNTATEHAMMERLMLDSLLVWARDYKIDAFRFDLMGHHMLDNMIKARDLLRSLSLERDGVDGSAIYLYGEGWNFGEVANNARGVNATQLNLYGQGIGTFSDRLRDAVRGGNPFGGLLEQGFATGLYTNPNGADQGSPEAQRRRLLHFADQIRVGLAGNLAEYPLRNRDGASVTGRDIDYHGQPAGYTASPEEVITYVSKHDNETLFDVIQYKAPREALMADRVRMQNLALSLVAFSQGVPFFHAGSDMLRSKSLDRDSYDSGDWFNRLDFTYQTNNWGVGLPPAWSNRNNWPLQRTLLGTLPAPEPEHIQRTVEHFRELLAIRYSSRLFRLETAEDIIARLRFHNTGPEQTPGLIVMSLSDDVEGLPSLDPAYRRIVVVFNATPSWQAFHAGELAGLDLRLHPVQRRSSDLLVPFSRYRNDGTLTVPPLTTAVFVQAR